MLLASCTTLRVPLRPPAYPQQDLLRGAAHGIELAVHPIVLEEEYSRLFDDNLAGIGIVAIWVEVRNLRSEAIELDLAKWSLRIGSRRFRALAINELYQRYYGAYRVRMYSVSADRAARRDMELAALPRGSMLPATSGEGYLFFRIDSGLGNAWNRGARLVLTDFSPGLGSKTSIEIALSHANP
jgi:hypothetical protein